MAGFVFKMQSLLNVKLQIEEQFKNELGKAVRKLEKEKKWLIQLEAELDDHIQQMNDKSSQGVLISDLRNFTAYLSHLKQKILMQKENINVARQNVDTYREQLIKAMQEKEMLQKLKDRKYATYLKEQLKIEQKMNDEIVSYHYSSADTGEENG